MALAQIKLGMIEGMNDPQDDSQEPDNEQDQD